MIYTLLILLVYAYSGCMHTWGKSKLVHTILHIYIYIYMYGINK
jgi:hypothetical protein